MKECAQDAIPKSKPRRFKSYIKDPDLKTKCRASKNAGSSWQDAGRPKSGTLYESMLSTKKAVKRTVQACRAREE